MTTAVSRRNSTAPAPLPAIQYYRVVCRMSWIKVGGQAVRYPCVFYRVLGGQYDRELVYIGLACADLTCHNVVDRPGEVCRVCIGTLYGRRRSPGHSPERDAEDCD